LGGQTAKKECNRGFGNTESQSGNDEAMKRERTRREWMNPREKTELRDNPNGSKASLLRALPKLRAIRPFASRLIVFFCLFALVAGSLYVRSGSSYAAFVAMGGKDVAEEAESGGPADAAGRTGEASPTADASDAGADDAAGGEWRVLTEGDVYKLRKEMTDGD
jgi:hypothetical protein